MNWKSPRRSMIPGEMDDPLSMVFYHFIIIIFIIYNKPSWVFSIQTRPEPTDPNSAFPTRRTNSIDFSSWKSPIPGVCGAILGWVSQHPRWDWGEWTWSRSFPPRGWIILDVGIPWNPTSNPQIGPNSLPNPKFSALNCPEIEMKMIRVGLASNTS